MSADPAVDVAGVVAAHQQRWRTLDPLLAPPVLDDSGPPLHTVRTEGGDGIGRFLEHVVTEDDEAALWGALRTHRLQIHLGGTDPVAPFEAILEHFERFLVEQVEPGDADSAALVNLPSRARELVAPLMRRGFAPTTVVAARSRTARSLLEPPPDAVARIREATPSDLDVLVELAVELNRFDASFGAVSERSSTFELLRASIQHQLKVAPGWTWVAELDGRIVGLAQMQPPTEAAWIASAVAASPIAYLAMLYVRPQVRSAGLGSALAAAAHRAVDEVEVEVTLLHHSLPNAWSTPFWAQQGYRPLWTAWQRRPAVRV